MESSQSDTTRRRRDACRAVCRLIITNAIRSLTNHTSTVTLCGIPGPRAIGKESRLHILEFSGRSHSYPRTSLSTLLEIPRHPSLTAFAHPHSAPLIYWKANQSTITMPSASIGTYSIGIGPVGKHTEKGRGTLLASVFVSGGV